MSIIDTPATARIHLHAVKNVLSELRDIPPRVRERQDQGNTTLNGLSLAELPGVGDTLPCAHKEYLASMGAADAGIVRAIAALERIVEAIDRAPYVDTRPHLIPQHQQLNIIR